MFTTLIPLIISRRYQLSLALCRRALFHISSPIVDVYDKLAAEPYYRPSGNESKPGTLSESTLILHPVSLHWRVVRPA